MAPASLFKALRKATWETLSLGCGFVFLHDVVVSQAHVRGASMQPVLNPEGSVVEDWVMVDKFSVRLSRLKRGDVVTMRSPDNPKQIMIKRLIALEGDWLTLPGRVDVHKIPKGRCWVEGDNLDASRDSFTTWGCIPLAMIEGRVTHVIWPPSRWGRVPPEPPTGRLMVRNMHALSEDWRTSSYDL